MLTHYCPDGHGNFDKDELGKRVLGKVGGAAAGAVAGGVTKNPGWVIFGALVGMAVGHYVDEQVLPTCPECGLVLQIIEISLL